MEFRLNVKTLNEQSSTDLTQQVVTPAFRTGDPSIVVTFIMSHQIQHAHTGASWRQRTLDAQ